MTVRQRLVTCRFSTRFLQLDSWHGGRSSPRPPTRTLPSLRDRRISVEARFCKACGAALVAPPPTCPACETPSDPRGSKFCANCGTAAGRASSQTRRWSHCRRIRVPRRPTRAPADTDVETRPNLPHPAWTVDNALRMQREAAANLPAARPPSNGILSNVLMFVAFLAGDGRGHLQDEPRTPRRSVQSIRRRTSASRRQCPHDCETSSAAPAVGCHRGDRRSRRRGSSDRSFSATACMSGGGTLFVIRPARPASRRGPPVAVKKVGFTDFPAKLLASLRPNTMLKGMPFQLDRSTSRFVST